QLAPAGFEARIAPLKALSNGKSPARRRPHAGRAVCNVDFGPLSRPTTAALPGRRELVFMPLKRPCRRDRGTARSGGNPSFSICQACDAHALKAVIYSLKPPHHPTLRLFPKCRWQVERQGDILIQGTAA